MGEAALTWENELTELDVHAAKARSGGARLVTLVGDRTHRTIIADECAADRLADGFVVLRAPLAPSVSAQPAGSVLAALIAELSDEHWATLPAGARATLRRLAADGPAGEALPVEVPFAVADLLGSLTSHDPVAIVVDALDDADQGDLAALLYAVRASASRPLLVVAGRDVSSTAELGRALSPGAIAVLSVGAGGADAGRAMPVDSADRELVTGLVDRGRCREALLAAGVWERHRSAERVLDAVGWADVALAGVQAGRADDARVALGRARAMASGADPSSVWHVRARTTEVLVAIELWRRAAWSAGQCLRALRAGASTARAPWAAMVQALVRDGRAADAAEVLELAAQHANAATVAHCRAVFAAGTGAADALSRWEDAYRLADAVGDLAGRAAVAMSLAAARRDAGRSDDSAAVLAVARSWAADVGMTSMLGRADAMAHVVGPRGSIADFSAVEAAVADLVAAGRSNREIGNELMVSVRTVEAHLTRAFRKAGVRTRSELTAYWLARRT